MFNRLYYRFFLGKLNFEEFSDIMESTEGGEKIDFRDLEIDIDDADYSPLATAGTEDDSPKKKSK